MSSLELPLHTSRLSLRAYEEADAERLQRFYARGDMARYLLDSPWTQDLARQRVATRIPQIDLDGDTGTLAVVVELEGEVIGDVTLWFTDRERRVAEIGWVLDPAHGGRGFAREAVTALLDLAFSHYGMHRVVAQMDARNAASASLATAVGMQREAHHRQNWWSKGEWTDTLVFAMLAADRGAS